MATKAQIEANRRNGRMSRGPKTVVGKCQSRRNALKHGLAAEIVANKPAPKTALYEQVFLKVAHGDRAARIYARAAAEAQQVIDEVRELRIRLISDAQASPWTFSRPVHWLDRARFHMRRMPISEVAKRALGGWQNETFEIVDRPFDEAQSLAICLRKLAPELRQLQRYERNAFCKRRKALKTLLGF